MTTKKTTSFNWKKWLIVIAVILLIFPLGRYIYNQVNKLINDTKDNKAKTVEAERLRLQKYYQLNPLSAQNARDKITTRKDIQQASQDLAHNLGTKYLHQFDIWSPSTWTIFNVKAWTENDKKVADILLYQNKNYALLKRLYNEIDTENRNLTNDIYSLLDSSELKRVTSKLKLT